MKCDLHVHTKYSYDCYSSPEKMVDMAIKKGIDCIAITDHNSTKGAVEAMEYAKGKPILVIPSIEVKSRDGDIIALNVRNLIPKKLPAGETIEKIHEQGGLAIIAHPFGDLHPFKKKIKDFVGKVDGIETLNASILGGNAKAKKLAEQYGLAFTAGSDVHYPRFIGRAYLEIPGSNLTAKQVIEAIKDKNCKIGGSEFYLFEKLTERFTRGLIRILKFLRKCVS